MDRRLGTKRLFYVLAEISRLEENSPWLFEKLDELYECLITRQNPESSSNGSENQENRSQIAEGDSNDNTANEPKVCINLGLELDHLQSAVPTDPAASSSSSSTTTARQHQVDIPEPEAFVDPNMDQNMDNIPEMVTISPTEYAEERLGRVTNGQSLVNEIIDSVGADHITRSISSSQKFKDLSCCIEYLHIYFNLKKKIGFVCNKRDVRYPNQIPKDGYNTSSYACVHCSVSLFNIKEYGTHYSIELLPSSLEHKCTLDQVLECCKASLKHKNNVGLSRNPESSGNRSLDSEAHVANLKYLYHNKFGEDIRVLKMYVYLTNQKNLFNKPITEANMPFLKMIIKKQLSSSNITIPDLSMLLTKVSTEVLLNIMQLDNLETIEKLNKAMGWNKADKNLISFGSIFRKYQFQVRKNLRNHCLWESYSKASNNDAAILSCFLNLDATKSPAVVFTKNAAEVFSSDVYSGEDQLEIKRAIQIGGRIRLKSSDDLDINTTDNYQQFQNLESAMQNESTKTDSADQESLLQEDIEEIQKLLGVEESELNTTVESIIKRGEQNDTDIPLDKGLEVQSQENGSFEKELGEDYKDGGSYKDFRHSLDNELIQKLGQLKDEKPNDVVDGLFFTVSKDLLKGLNTIPIIGVNASVIKMADNVPAGRFETLFVASLADEDNKSIPIAYMLGNGQSVHNWCSFLKLLVATFRDSINMEEVFVISDNHPSIVQSVNWVFGVDKHLQCYFHLRRKAKQVLGALGTIILQHLCQTLNKESAMKYQKFLLSKLSRSGDTATTKLISEKLNAFARVSRPLDFELFTSNLVGGFSNETKNLRRSNYRSMIAHLLDLQYLNHRKRVILGKRYKDQMRNNARIGLNFWLNLSRYMIIKKHDGKFFEVGFDRSLLGNDDRPEVLKRVEKEIVHLNFVHQKLVRRDLSYSSFRSPQFKSLLEVDAIVTKSFDKHLAVHYSCSLCSYSSHYCIHIIRVISEQNNISDLCLERSPTNIEGIEPRTIIETTSKDFIKSMCQTIDISKIIQLYNVHKSSVYNGEITHLPKRHNIETMLFLTNKITNEEFLNKPKVANTVAHENGGDRAITEESTHPDPRIVRPRLK